MSDQQPVRQIPLDPGFTAHALLYTILPSSKRASSPPTAFESNDQALIFGERAMYIGGGILGTILVILAIIYLAKRI